MTKIISEFQGDFRWLSNFWPVYGTTAEHLYQAAKMVHPEDARAIMSELTPTGAKIRARAKEIRTDWESSKLEVMLQILRWKFTEPSLRQKLLDTEDAILEEGNRWKDTYWGVCPPLSGNGSNHLGRLLMKVRDEIQRSK